MSDRKPVVDYGNGAFGPIEDNATLPITTIPISGASGNALRKRLDGLYVPSTETGCSCSTEPIMFTARMDVGAKQELPFDAVQAMNQFSICPIDTTQGAFRDSRFYAPVSGVYEFYFRASALPRGGRLLLGQDWGCASLVVNGYEVASNYHFNAARDDGYMQFNSGGVWVVLLDAGDIVRPRILQHVCTGGMQVMSGNNTEFIGRLMWEV